MTYADVSVTDVIQSAAILVGLGITVWQWQQTRQMTAVSTMVTIMNALNDLRKSRAEDPELEGALFDSRRGWKPIDIKKRVFAVQFANILECCLLSRERGLISESEWQSWKEMWKGVILRNPTIRGLMSDPTIYSFKPEACEEVNEWIAESQADVPDPERGDRADSAHVEATRARR